MKKSNPPHRTKRLLAAICIGSALVLPAGLHAKPGEGSGNGKGGGPAHTDQGKPKNGKNDHPGKGGGNGKGNKGHSDHQPGNGKKHDGKFVDGDRDLILSFFAGYRGEANGLPPGLAKNVRRGKPLPPGWQKKLQVGHVIDGEWWDRLVPVPDGMIPNLPLIDNTGLYYYGDRVYRVHRERREVIDVVIVPTIHIDL